MNSVIATYLPGACFHDALTISVDDSSAPALAYFLKALLATPIWVDRLMSFRNYVMAKLGFKDLGTLSRLDRSKPASTYVTGDHVGIFTLMMNSPGEALLGVKDKHLDVTLSIYKSCELDDKQAQITVTTVVHTHNWFGRLYMLPVTPMHRIIGPTVLKTIAKPSA